MRGRLIGAAFMAVSLAATPCRAETEWQVKPFIGFSFAPSTTIYDPYGSVGGANRTFGVTAQVLGEVFGLEGELGRLSGLFSDEGTPSGQAPVIAGSVVTTATGNLVVALPRRVAEYGLRPYGLAGGGLIRVNITTPSNVLDVTDSMWGFDFGGGVTGFFNRHVGVSWEVRRFTSMGGYSLDLSLLQSGELDQKLSFWRATFAVAIR
jgi:hypothetical protein